MNKFLQENKPDEGLGRQSVRSGVVSILSRGINAVLQVGSTVILARLLVPEDFGLVAMVAAITGFAPVLMDLGTRDATVQKAKITQDEVSAIFWLNVAIAVVISVGIAVSGPLIAKFYDEPRVAKVAVFSALSFLFSGLCCQHFALMRRAMMFGKIAKIELSGQFVGSVIAIAAALAGAGYWALVAKPILTAFFTMAGVWLSCRWLPGVPRLTAGVKEMLRFGLNVTGFTLTDFVARSADRIALGYSKGAAMLGFYQNASFIYDNPLQLLVVPLHTVAVASLSKLRDQPDELRAAWAKALSSFSFYGMPAFALLAINGHEVVALLLGAKWAFAGAILTVLALRGPAHLVERTLGWLHIAAGRPDRWMRWGVVSCAVQLLALFCGLPYGAIGIAVAYVISTYILFIPAIVYAGKPLDIGFRRVIAVIGRQLTGAILIMGVGFLMKRFLLSGAHPVASIAATTLVCGGIYLLVVAGLFRLTEPLRLGLRLVPARLRPARNFPIPAPKPEV